MSRPAVELLYKDGVLIDYRECRDGEPRQYGRAETPDRGYVVVRLLCRLRDLPPELLECGGKMSRFKLDEGRMSDEERKLFKDGARFKHGEHAIKHTIDPERLAKLVVDNSPEWEAKKEEWRRRNGR